MATATATKSTRSTAVRTAEAKPSKGQAAALANDAKAAEAKTLAPAKPGVIVAAPAKPAAKRGTSRKPEAQGKLTAEAAKAVTDAKQEKTLAPLVKAVVTGLALVTKADLSYDAAKLQAENTRVVTMRAIAKLAEHPATFAKGGPTKGKPSVEVIATLVGWKRQTFTPLFKGAMALKAANLHNKRAVPTEAERTIANVGYATEAERSAANRAKEKAAKGPKSGPVLVKGKPVGKPENSTDGTAVRTAADIAAAVDALQAMVTAYAEAEQGYTAKEAEAITAKLQAIANVVEAGTTAK